MPDILPTINNEPAQGIQALLDTVYLWNPDVANGLIDKVNELLEELGELSNISGAIKPYSQLEAPVRQYMPMSYNDGVYVANEEMTTLPATPDLSKWTLIATKVDEQAIEAVVANEAEARAAADSALQGAIREEALARQAADNNLQTQIDAISAASDVTDIVGTHAELENYDTSTLSDNDIIKVLQDETQEDATTYYRWVAAEDEFQLIGEEGPYYTKAQTDTLLEAKQDIMQFETMPEADASNANKVIQYVGEDIPESPASAVATQTVGSSLTDLSVNVDTFVEAEQPSGAETVTFVCTGASLSLTNNPTTRNGITVAIDESVFFAKFAQLQTGIDITTAQTIAIEWYANQGSSFIDVAEVFINTGGGASYSEEIYRTDPGLEIDKLSEWGVTITGAPEVFQWRGFNFAPAQSTVTWSKNGVEVDISNYGVTYDGSPVVGDTIAVSYAPAVKPVTSGYFYVNTPAYSEPVATIEQTVGGDNISFETTSGNTTISGDIQAFNNLLSYIGWAPSDVPDTGTLLFTWSETDDAWFLELPLSSWNGYYTQNFLEEMGFVFTGTPVDGDAITATYHFGLLDLSINIDTFSDMEHPTGDETINFVASSEIVFNELHIDTSTTVGGIPVATTITNQELFFEKARATFGDEIVDNGETVTFGYFPGTEWSVAVCIDGDEHRVEGQNPAEWGVEIVAGDEISIGDGAWVYFDLEHVTSWARNGTTVDIYEYGVTYSGNPGNGDTITVNYTAPYITGYTWEQINVQPGGTGGIKWAGRWDKPASTTWTYYYPHYTFPTLPDGNYELTVQSKSLYQYTTGVQVWSYKTFKVTFGVTNHRAQGIAAWVLDGNTDFYNNNLSSIVTFTHWSSYNDPIPLDRIVPDTVGTCRIWNSTVRASDVDGVFRWTNIRNTDTGEEIPVEIEVLQNQTGSGYQIGSYNSGNAVNPPSIPTAWNYFTDNCNDSMQYVWFSNPLLPLVDTVAYCGSFEIVLKDADGSEWRCVVENNMHSYVARVLKASGIFANTQLGWSDGVGNGSTCVFLNTPAGTDKTIEVWVTLYGNNVSADCWMAQSAPNFTPALVTRPGSLVTIDNFGLIEQYTGETDANYVNGYFYKATGTKVDVPESITTTTVSPAGEATVTVDLANWIDAVAETYGWALETVRSWLTEYVNTVWNLSYNVDNGEVTRMYLPWYGDTYEQNILQYITVDYTGSQEGEVWVEFQEQYAKAHTEIQNGHWERIDVQPTSGGLPSQTGNEGMFLVTNGTDASWDNTVTTYTSATNRMNTVMNFKSTYGDTTSTVRFKQAPGATTLYIEGGFTPTSSRTRDLGSSGYRWRYLYTRDINIEGHFISGEAEYYIPPYGSGALFGIVSSLPNPTQWSAGTTLMYGGATDSNYTHGYVYECRAQGTDPETYAWEQVDVQPSSGGATYTAGAGISIDSNNEISTQDIPAEALADTSGLALDAGAPYALMATYSEDTQEVSMAYENVVTQVNGVTGDVRFDAQSILAVPQWNPATEDPFYRPNSIIQSNTTYGSYTEGYFYKSVPSATPQVATIDSISSTGATNIAISNQATLDSWCESWSDENGFDATIEYLDGSWQWQDSAQDFGSDLSTLGITYDGTPDEGDQFNLDWPQKEYEWQQINVQPDSTTLTPNFNRVKFNGLSTLQSRDYYMDVSSQYYLRIGTGASQTANDLLIRTGTGVKTIAFSSSGGILGSATGKFARVHTEKLNNGADITIPTTGGTMAVIGVNTTVTLATVDWSSNTQTVSVTGMTADGVVLVSPTPANQSAYTSAGILCTAQAAGSLTFTCDTVPSADITVTVVML